MPRHQGATASQVASLAVQVAAMKAQIVGEGVTSAIGVSTVRLMLAAVVHAGVLSLALWCGFDATSGGNIVLFALEVAAYLSVQSSDPGYVGGEGTFGDDESPLVEFEWSRRAWKPG